MEIQSADKLGGPPGDADGDLDRIKALSKMRVGCLYEEFREGSAPREADSDRANERRRPRSPGPGAP